MTETTQVTQIEQARAVAEIAASVRVAQERPRDEDLAIARFKRSCSRLEFAQRAIFRLPRGGKITTGPTIAFAIEAARCWGNTTSGSAEIERIDGAPGRPGRSTVVAFSWDLETNFTRRTTFVSPHTGYTDRPEMGEDGTLRPARSLVDPRSVRESNQSTASRVEREQILGALPVWFVEMGKAWCAATIAGQSGGKPIEDRRRQMVETFEGIGVRREELIRKVGAPVDSWVELDLATLTVLGAAIKNGETTIEEAFDRRTSPQPRTSVDIMRTMNPDGQQPGAVEGEAVSTTDVQMATRAEVNGILARMGELGIAGRGNDVRERRLRLLRLLVERADDAPPLTSTNDLTQAEVGGVRSWLAAATPEAVVALLDEDAPADEPGEPG